MTTAPSQANDEAIRAAHERLVQDPTLQFDLAHPVAPSPPPAWLGWFGDLLNAIAPLLSWIFWGGLAVVVCLILFFIGREILAVRFGWKRKPPKKAESVPEWRPTEAAARTLLADADRLAAEGLFAEAVHLLLLRSIDDLDSRRPQAVRPAQTARELGSLEALPAAARPAFGKISRVVELSLFGGAPVDSGAFADCRRAYEEFALPSGWSR